MIGTLWYKFFWGSYDNLGKLVLLNLIISILFAPLILIFFGFPPLIGYLLSLITVPIPIAGLFYFVSKVTEETDPILKDFFIGLKKFALKGVLLYLFHTLILIILFYNAKFYLGGKLFSQSGFISMILAGICIWAGFYSIMLAIYTVPILVNQNISFKKLFIRANIMFLSKPFFAIAVLLNLLFLSLIVYFTKFVGFFIFFISFSAVMMNSAYQTVMEYYEELEAAEKAKKEGVEKPKSWKEIKEQEVAKKKKRHRSLREILKPWEY